MISKESCPFADTEKLTQTTDSGNKALSTEITNIIEKLKKDHPESEDNITRLDDYIFAIINGTQTSTIRAFVCPVCDQDLQCHPK